MERGGAGGQEEGEAEIKRSLFCILVLQQCWHIIPVKLGPGLAPLPPSHVEKPLSSQAKPAISILYLDMN